MVQRLCREQPGRRQMSLGLGAALGRLGFEHANLHEQARKV